MTLKEKITEIFNKHNLDYDCDYDYVFQLN